MAHFLKKIILRITIRNPRFNKYHNNVRVQTVKNLLDPVFFKFKLPYFLLLRLNGFKMSRNHNQPMN